MKRNIFVAFLAILIIAYPANVPLVNATVPVYPSGMLAVHRFYNVK